MRCVDFMGWDYNDKLEMNKKKQMKYDLNTITIGYTKRAQSPIPLILSRKDSELKRDKDSWNDSSNDSHRKKSIDQLDFVFSDHRLQDHGKSQTMKESQLNRLRIYIHRKQRKGKWHELKLHQSQVPGKTDEVYDIEEKMDSKRQFKTAFEKRRGV